MTELTVSTYNTHRERSGPDPLLKDLLRERHSVCCLQEVSPTRALKIKYATGSRSFVSFGKHGLQWLAIVLPKNARFLSCKTIQLNGYFGLLPAVWSVDLGRTLYGAGSRFWTDALEPRVAQVARILWDDIEFLLINVHMPLVPSLRNRSLVLLRNSLRDRNVILAGDLNAVPEDLFLNDMVLAEGLSLAGTEEPTHDSRRRIDYVMFRGDFRETGHSLASGLSDHRMLQTKLEV